MLVTVSQQSIKTILPTWASSCTQTVQVPEEAEVGETLYIQFD